MNGLEADEITDVDDGRAVTLAVEEEEVADRLPTKADELAWG